MQQIWENSKLLVPSDKSIHWRCIHLWFQFDNRRIPILQLVAFRYLKWNIGFTFQIIQKQLSQLFLKHRHRILTLTNNKHVLQNLRARKRNCIIWIKTHWTLLYLRRLHHILWLKRSNSISPASKIFSIWRLLIVIWPSIKLRCQSRWKSKKKQPGLNAENYVSMRKTRYSLIAFWTISKI